MCDIYYPLAFDYSADGVEVPQAELAVFVVPAPVFAVAAAVVVADVVVVAGVVLVSVVAGVVVVDVVAPVVDYPVVEAVLSPVVFFYRCAQSL